MRQLLLILSFIVGVLSFNKENDTGKKLFERNCASCHNATKTLIGPPFQNIRQDYGLKWTIEFIKNNQLLIKQRDTKALCIYYTYNETLQPKFDKLNNADIIKILDYVDTFPIDSSLYKHRHVSDIQRRKYISQFEANEKKQWKEFKKSLNERIKDTLPVKRRSSYGNKKNGI